tara:strand:+ start:849 stop:1187 length:339 start_codon:yes stop_codon:yes gene_type:complete
MTYTINGKQYTEFDINKRCAELLGVHVEVKGTINDMYLDKDQDEEYSPCINPADTDAIINKCWDELMKDIGREEVEPELDEGVYDIKWVHLIKKRNCTKLVAACICLIELNE